MTDIPFLWKIALAFQAFDLIKFVEGMDTMKLLKPLKVLPFYTTIIYGALILLLVSLIVQTVATCFLFNKADVPWWKALIPIGGTYNSYGLADCEVIFCFNLLISVVFLPLLNADMPIAILSIYLLLMIVLEFVYCAFLSRTFGHGIGYAIGLFLLRPVFLMILAFDNSTYCFGGHPKKPAVTEEVSEEATEAAATEETAEATAEEPSESAAV